MNTVDFLRHVLAAEGWKCVDIKLKKGFGHNWFDDVEAAAAYAQSQDAIGKTVYFACATFKTPTNRKQVNVAYLKSFWGDCDVGPDKPYKTRQEAEDALVAFLKATGLPPPTIVYSGASGLHLYWVLEEAISPEQWRPLAEAFRALCKQHGFHLDHTRTADHSSVLRPPETHNRKRELAEPVTVAYVSTPVALDLLPFNVGPKLLQRARNVIAAPAAKGLLQNAAVYDERPSDAHKIAVECAQIRNLRDTKGNIPYQAWLLTGWTLHFTIQGDAIVHDWSSGHPNYTEEETQRKLDEATAPIKCTTFDKLNDLCKACKHWGKISTPLQLGRTAAVPEQLPNVVPQSREIETAGPYINDEKGLRLLTEDKKNQPLEVKISRWPIFVDAVGRDERNGDFSIFMTMKTPHMNSVSINIGQGMLFSAQGMSEVHRMGAVIHHPDFFRDYVRRTVDSMNERNEPQTRYSQMGWKDHDNAFLVGLRLYTQNQFINVQGIPEIERRAKMLGPRTGSLAGWTAAANKLFALGCEPQSFALMCAFAAPFMRFLSADEGGAIVNLVSEQSATGKTTGLEAIASVWGELDGLRLLDEDTQISRGILLGTLGNLPCVFDELHKRDPDSIRQFVTMFTSGRDKLRAKQDGSIREPAGEWQTILILGSNVSLADILRSKNSEEAQAFRVLELIAEQKFTGHEGDSLRRQLKENAGWAGDAFIHHLMQPGMLPQVRAELDKIVGGLWQCGFAQKHRFWVRCMACAYVAGALAADLHILNFEPGRIIKWVAEHLLENKDVVRDNAQVLSEALYEVWASTLVVDAEWKPHTTCLVLVPPSQNRMFLGRRVRNNGRVYITRSWLYRWLTEHNINRTAFIKDLRNRKIIVNDNKFVTLGAGTDYNTGGQVVCIELDMLHPDMAGALAVTEQDVKLSARLPAAEAQPPRSTLQ